MLKKILIVLGVIVVAIGVLGFVAPTDFHVENEVVIDRPKAEVFEHLRAFKSHSAWSPWEKRDPNMVKTFRGTDGAVGFVVAWSGNSEVGAGEQEFTNIVDGERIDFELRFSEPMQDTSMGYLVTEAVSENQTKVKWGMKGENPFPGNVFCLLMNMEGMIKKDFDEGLAALKAHLEGR